MSGRKRLSGDKYRKKKSQREHNLQKQSCSLNKCIKTSHKEEGGSSELECSDGSSDKLTSLSIGHNTSLSPSDDGGNVSNAEHSNSIQYHNI
jgi:hypothetical protein